MLASIPDFEEAFFGESVSGDKPCSALARLKGEEEIFLRIATLLDCLVDPSKQVPKGAAEWNSIDALDAAVVAFDASSEAPPSAQ